MSSDKKTIYYTELRAGDPVQDGDQFRDVDGQWKPYIFKAHMGGQVGYGVTARRPIRATHQTTFEEVPGTRTLQQAVEQPQRKRWAYEELQPDDVVQEGDQWLNPDGRWQAIVLTPEASMEVGEALRVRRPHSITLMLAEFANQAEVLAEVRADEKRLFDDLELLRSEYIKLQDERDNALAALKSAQRARDELQLQVDELRADRERLQGLIDNLLDEPTAKRVYKMLEDMLDQTEWVGQCLDSTTYEQMSCIQRTISVIAERVNEMGKEAASADA